MNEDITLFLLIFTISAYFMALIAFGNTLSLSGKLDLLNKTISHDKRSEEKSESK